MWNFTLVSSNWPTIDLCNLWTDRWDRHDGHVPKFEIWHVNNNMLNKVTSTGLQISCIVRSFICSFDQVNSWACCRFTIPWSFPSYCCNYFHPGFRQKLLYICQFFIVINIWMHLHVQWAAPLTSWDSPKLTIKSCTMKLFGWAVDGATVVGYLHTINYQALELTVLH